MNFQSFDLKVKSVKKALLNPMTYGSMVIEEKNNEGYEENIEKSRNYQNFDVKVVPNPNYHKSQINALAYGSMVEVEEEANKNSNYQIEEIKSNNYYDEEGDDYYGDYYGNDNVQASYYQQNQVNFFESQRKNNNAYTNEQVTPEDTERESSMGATKINSRMGTIVPGQLIASKFSEVRNWEEIENMKMEIMKLAEENNQLKNKFHGRQSYDPREPKNNNDYNNSFVYEGPSLGDRPSIIQPHLGFVNTHQKAQTKGQHQVFDFIDPKNISPSFNTDQQDYTALYNYKPSHGEFAKYKRKLTQERGIVIEDKNEEDKEDNESQISYYQNINESDYNRIVEEKNIEISSPIGFKIPTNAISMMDGSRVSKNSKPFNDYQGKKNVSEGSETSNAISFAGSKMNNHIMQSSDTKINTQIQESEIFMKEGNAEEERQRQLKARIRGTYNPLLAKENDRMNSREKNINESLKISQNENLSGSKLKGGRVPRKSRKNESYIFENMQFI